MAVRLGLAFGVEPRFWSNLQAQYDIEVIEREHGKALAAEISPLREAA
jgi:plasmid maintenance system antidote protein VapI